MASAPRCRPTPTALLKHIQRYLQIPRAVGFRLGQAPAEDVDLQGVEDELGHRQFAVSAVLHVDVVHLIDFADLMMLVGLALLAHGALPLRFAVIGAVVVAGERRVLSCR